MPEATSLITAAFIEAVNQLTTYLGLGISAAISALVLDFQSARRVDAEVRAFTGKATPEDEKELSRPAEAKAVSVPGTSIEVLPSTAKWLLVGAYAVAGCLAYTTALSALAAAQALGAQPELLHAVCLYPGVATSPLWLRLTASCLPPALVGWVMWRIYTRVKHAFPTEGAARYTMPLVTALPYAALAAELWKLPC
jgi:membrane protein YqaA with SNARE-associated domain